MPMYTTKRAVAIPTNNAQRAHTFSEVRACPGQGIEDLSQDEGVCLLESHYHDDCSEEIER